MLATEDHFDVEACLFGDVNELDSERRSYDRGRRTLGRGASLRFKGLAGVSLGLCGLLAEDGACQIQYVFERQDQGGSRKRHQESATREWQSSRLRDARLIRCIKD
jgi:hypothetical protein